MASMRDSVSVDGATMKLYLSMPDGAGPFPAVVVIQHQGGVDEFIEEMTDRVGAAGYIGVAPDGVAPFARTAEIGCPLLGLFGEDDGNPSPADMKKLDAELTRLGKAHEFHSYPGANHAFMNRRGARYHEAADRDSWPRAVAFFGKHLRGLTVAATAAR